MSRINNRKDRELLEQAKKEIEEKESPYGNAERLAELRKIKIPKIDVIRGYGYLEESEFNYVHECFRSCIFSCASVIEIIFKDILVWNSEDPEELQWRIIVEKWTFGKLINEGKKHLKLKEFIQDAKWLNDLRNEIAVHPMYLGISWNRYIDVKDLSKLILYNKMMLRSLKILLKFLDEKSKKKFLESELESRGQEGKLLRKIRLMDLLQGDPSIMDFVRYLYWAVTEQDILHELAYQAYKYMGKILIGLQEYLSP